MKTIKKIEIEKSNLIPTGLLAGLAALLLSGATARSQTEGFAVLTANDASGFSSWTNGTYWNPPGVPGPGTNYSTGGFTLRTPPAGASCNFAGDSLTLAASVPVGGSTLNLKINNGGVVIMNNCTNAGGAISCANGGYTYFISGNMVVVSNTAFWLQADATRTLIFSNLNLSGAGVIITNGSVGNGLGKAIYECNASAYTGSMVADYGTILEAYAQTNLFGNPPSFNAGQLVLNNGTFVPLASMALNNPNGGVTLGVSNGTFIVGSGLTLAIADPITGSGGLTNLGGGALVLDTTNTALDVPGTNTYTGPTVVAGTLQLGGGTLLVNGTHTVASGATGAYTINSGGTLGGGGLIDLSAVNLGVTIASGGRLSPGAAANTAGTLTFNLGTGILDISGAVTPVNSSALLFDLGAINASDEVVLTSGTLNIGNGVLNFGSFDFNALAGLQAGTYTLFQAPTITGTLGAGLSGVVGGYNATLSLSGGSLLLTLGVPSLPVPVISNLTPSQTIRPGVSASTLTLTGNVAANGPIYPPQGESGTISVTINGVTATGAFTDAVGDFSITFNNTASIPLSGTPYIITYSYAGDASLAAAADNDSTKLTTQAPVVLKASDALGSTSFNAVGNWVLDGTTTAAPTPPTAGNYYNTEAFGLRTPAATGTYTFAGDLVVFPVGGTLIYKGTGAADTIIGNWILAGGSLGNGVGGDNPTFGGTMTVTAPSAISPGGSGRSIIVTATISGSGLLTNGFGYAGILTYTNDNATAFTGPMLINGGTKFITGSQTNIGGNPASFNPAQLILDDAVVQVLGSLTMNNPNSGVTLNPGGGAFNVSAGNTLAIANPITGPGGLTNLAAGSLVLATTNTVLNVAGTNTYAGPTVINSGTLLVNGTHIAGPSATGGYTIKSGATLGGNGLIDLSAASLSVTIASGGTLSPGAAAHTAGVLTLNLGSGTLDISGAVTPAASDSLLFDLGAINGSDEVVLTSGTLTIGSGVLNFDDFNFNALAGLQAGTYTLFQTPNPINGTLGPNLTGVLGGYNAALAINGNGNNLQLTLTVPAHPLPVFSNLTPSQTIAPGTPSITLTGNVAAIGPTYPPQGESGTVSATINGVTCTGTFTDAVGDFSITFTGTAGILFSPTPYTITYNYAGDATLGAGNNNSTTLSIQTPIVLDATDALGSSSFNTVGNWVLYGTLTPPPTGPTAGNSYNTQGYVVRTPATAGNYNFAGDSLTIAPGGGLFIKGANGNIITVNNLINAGVISDTINNGAIGVIAGNMTVSGAAAFNTATASASDYRILTNSLVMSGTGILTNTCTQGAFPGLVVYTADNSAFTGPLIVNFDTTLQAGSQASLGGNPASFNPAQLTLDDGTFQPTASFAMNNANSGITITPNGGTFDVPLGLALTIDNPITNSPDGPGLLTSTDGGTLVLNGNDSGFTGGVSVMNGSTFDLGGSLGCGITGDGASTVEGTGTAAGTLDVSGTLIGGTAGTAGTLTAAGLVLETGATLGGSLGPATTVGQGINSLIQINGSVVLNNNNIVITPHGTLTVGSTYTLLACTGGISGSFAPVATTANSEYSFSVTQVTSGASTLIQLTVSAEENCDLTANDAPGSSSWNTAGNWSCGAAPVAGATYNTAGFELNTPAVAGNQTFAGDLLTIAPGGSVVYEGNGGADILSANWVLNGGAIVNGSAGISTPTIAGNLNLAGAGAINPGAGGTINIAATLTGTNLLTNGLGQAGTVIYTGADATAFTGPLLVNGGTVLQCGSQTNLGASPATFNAAQLTLDNGIFQPEASFVLQYTNSGITVTTNGGTIDVPTGLTLTIDNPLTGRGVLTNTDDGELVLNSAGSGFTGGLLVVNGATLDLVGSVGCGITNDGSSTLEGSGAAAGTVDVSGTLIPGTATTAGTLTVGGLVLEGSATLTVNLSSTTTVGQGTNSFIQVNGNLTLNNNIINLNFLSHATVGNTYTVLACTGAIHGSLATPITTANGDVFDVVTVATASNTLVQVTFASEPTYYLIATDVINTSSWNTGGNWNNGAAPVAGASYNTANFVLRTPSAAGNYTFAGDSLTIANGGDLYLKGGNGNIITINDLTNSGTIDDTINTGAIGVIAGNMTVVGGANFNTAATGGSDFRILTNTMTMAGSAPVTNTDTVGAFPGVVVYTGANTAFTGPLIVNNDTTIQAGSQANLGGNPASFNAAQLVLDDGILQANASFAMNNANSGITITPNGGAFDVPAGLTLTIANPITSSSAGLGTLTNTDSGQLVLNGNNSGFTGGLLVLNGATTDLNGPLGGGVTNDAASTLEGTGTVAGALDISGKLIGGTATTAGTLTAGGLVLESGAALTANLASATTVGLGVNSLIQVNGPMVLHTNTLIINALGALTPGGTYTVLACTGGVTGSFAPVARSATGTNTYSVALVSSGASTLVQATVPGAAAAPVFSSLTFVSGNLVFAGSNGVPNQPFNLLATTNLATPLADWLVVATNAFNANGQFNLTNAVQSGVQQQFFRLQPQ